jgi:hypothetical protein
MQRSWIFLLALAAPAHAEPARDGQADFDFVLGSWTIKNRMLRKQPDGRERWVEFASTSVNRPIWDGKANVEEWDGAGPSGRIQGVAVRLYDPAHRTWSIYWGDRRLGAMVLPPVVGHFEGARGEFFADGTTSDGKPSRDRVIWSKISKDTCRWEQASSVDGGKTWKTNWIMDFTRATP